MTTQNMAAWRPRAVALDIDGTLVDHEGVLPDQVRRSVRRVVAAGVPVVLTTGRSRHATRPVFEQLDLPPGPAIASNGAVTVAFPPFRLERVRTFDPAAVIEKVLREHPTAALAVEVIGEGFRVTKHFPVGDLTGEIELVSVDDLAGSDVTRLVVRDPNASAGVSVQRVEKALGQARLRLADLHTIIVTHADPDHVGALAALKEATGARIYATRIEADAAASGRASRELKPGLMATVFGLVMRFVTIRPVTVDEVIADGYERPAGGGLRAVETPGHTPGHLGVRPAAGGPVLRRLRRGGPRRPVALLAGCQHLGRGPGRGLDGGPARAGRPGRVLGPRSDGAHRVRTGLPRRTPTHDLSARDGGRARLRRGAGVRNRGATRQCPIDRSVARTASADSRNWRISLAVIEEWTVSTICAPPMRQGTERATPETPK